LTPFGSALDRRLDPKAKTPVALALSGGGDSLALLHLTMDWARAHDRPVLCLTVDHGLNRMSGAWTRDAGDKAKALGARWLPLRWSGPKPVSGIEAHARTARHTLLAEAARSAGARVLLMGHTADDLAEGEVMRRVDTPGLGRLREWSPSPVWPEGRGVFLLRPLLDVRRRELRAFLTLRGASWLEDPANSDPRFARVRARQALAGDAPAGMFRTDLDGAIPALARRLRVTADGAEIDRTALLDAPAGPAKAVLAAALLSVSGAPRPPRGAELDRLIGAVASGRVASLSHCRIDATCGVLKITRAPTRRGRPDRPLEPLAWAKARFASACGLVPDEAALRDL